MNKDFETKLIEAAPIFMKDMYGDVMKTCMHFGVACEDGWFKPLLKALKGIEAINRCSKGVVTAAQIKSKFACLCIYVDFTEDVSLGERDAVNAIIQSAEEECWECCEYCGEPAIYIIPGWFTRVCRDHKKKEDCL